jgi:hypothetical protein
MRAQIVLDLVKEHGKAPSRHRRYHRHLLLVALMSGDNPPTRAQLRHQHVRVSNKTFRNVCACVRNPASTGSLVPGVVERHIPRERILKVVAFLLSPVCVRTLAYGAKRIRTSTGQEVSCVRATCCARALSAAHTGRATRSCANDNVERDVANVRSAHGD